MTRFFRIALLVFITPFVASAQTGQLAISKVGLMPNLPSPYIMRDWKDVATRYDSLIYSLNAAGTYLPVMHLRSTGVNYATLQPILLDSYVGVNSHGNQAEGINIIPSVVGASLIGIDKSNQNGINWVLKTKDFFNRSNGQNIYLNGYSAASGGDWWYDVMPNVFFYQLYSQYPSTPDYKEQLTTIADRWLSAVKVMGGSTTPWTLPQMNYTAFNFATMTPVSKAFKEPESAGSIAWLLYNAYHETGDKKYLDGAQLSMGFLAGLNYNPAYEIQLPYGTFMAAKMNAELGTNYDISKMLNWSFDQSSERNWGTILGKWGDAGNIDVSGLVGEVDNLATGYAFTMNGYQQAAAFVPLVKYDKRFARDIAKWTLNLANASRLFYPKYLDPAHQDDYAWSALYDPHSSIAYESLKQNSLNNIKLYGTGDAKRNNASQTNLALYGSSHVGYLASLIQTTNKDGILLLDVNKTDFFGQKTFPSFLVYNPYATAQQVTVPLGASTYDIYDAITETVIQTGVTGNIQITLPANEARLLVYLPQGSSPVAVAGKLMLNGKVVDYNYGYSFAAEFRIRSLTAKDTLTQFNQLNPVYGSVENKSAPVTYAWYINGALSVSSADSVFHWTTPTVAGKYKIKLLATSGASSASDSLTVTVLSHVPVAPVTTGITKDSSWYYAGSKATLICNATNPDKTKLQYTWSVPGGTIVDQKDSLLHWTVPDVDGYYQVTCKVTNNDGMSVTAKLSVLVKTRSTGVTDPVAYFSLDAEVNDDSGHGHDATGAGVQLAPDSRGQSNQAFKFSKTEDIITVPNAASLNFQNQITMGFWLKLDQLPQEAYVLSHGSYEERWKVSVTPNLRLRWTVKTNASTVDLDTSFPLVIKQFYHFTVVYSGYSMEIYVDGVLDSFTGVGGLIATTSKDITLGRKDVAITDYHLSGTLDEFRIYDKALAPNEIKTLKTLFRKEAITGLEDQSQNVDVYPNPSSGALTISGIAQPVLNITMMDLTGRRIKVEQFTTSADNLVTVNYVQSSGWLLMKIETGTGIIYKKVIAW